MAPTSASHLAAVDLTVNNGWVKTCRGCHQMLPPTAFYANPNTIDGRLNWCKPCARLRYAAGKAERARQMRDYIARVKLERGCVDCGYNAHPEALDFDHLPGVEKVLRLSCMAESRRELIDAEIAKCEVVCANCHRIRTAQRRPELAQYERHPRYVPSEAIRST